MHLTATGSKYFVDGIPAEDHLSLICGHIILPLVVSKHDPRRQEADINNFDTAMAMSYFGTTMRGAVFAWSVIKRLAPLATGGALT